MVWICVEICARVFGCFLIEPSDIHPKNKREIIEKSADYARVIFVYLWVVRDMNKIKRAGAVFILVLVVLGLVVWCILNQIRKAPQESLYLPTATLVKRDLDVVVVGSRCLKGWFGRWIRQLGGQLAHLTLVEPNPREYARIRRLLPGVANIQVLQAAVDVSTSPRRSLFVHRYSQKSTMVLPHNEAEYLRMDVPTIDLASVLARRKQVDVLTLSIGGYDLVVLAAWLDKNQMVSPPTVVIVSTKHFGIDFGSRAQYRGVVQGFQRHGYDVYHQFDGGYATLYCAQRRCTIFVYTRLNMADT